MKVLSLLALFFSIHALQGQNTVTEKLDTLYPIPGLKTAKSTLDLDANVEITVSRDSLFFQIHVKDDVVVSGENKDRVEVWFGSPWIDFSDFIVGEEGKKTSIFRNSAEAGDNADLKRFLENGDYPKAELVHPETGEKVEALVPDARNLRREHVFVGLTRFIIPSEGNKIIHASRENYRAFEAQTSLKVEDLSSFATCDSKKTPHGYEINIRMSNSCIGFARPEFMNKIRFAVDVYDTDDDSEAEIGISTSKNRFYARSWYLNELVLPFSLNIPIESVSSDFIHSLHLNQDVVYTKNGWQAFGVGYGNIVYAKDIISEAGLTDFKFYKVDLNYTESNSPVLWQKLDISYNGLTVFDQHEVYLKVFDEMLSGKKYRYTGVEKNKFFYHVIQASDTSVFVPIYDYEPVDPLGFGEFGHTADEFIFIQQISKNSNRTIFNAGQRIEASNQITLGDEDPLSVEGVKTASYQWKQQGESFEVEVKGIEKSKNRTLLIRKNESGIFDYH